MNIGYRFVAASAACALGLGGVLAVAAPSGAQAAGGALVRMSSNAPPPVPAGAVRLGRLAPGTRLRLDVTLNVRDQAALSAFVAAVSDRQSPLFHDFLRPGQFGPRFGPTLSSIAAVTAVLRAAGLHPGRVSSNRLAIPVTATAAAAEHAFGVTLVRYRLSSGRVAYRNAAAPKIAGAVAPYVSGVLGLSNLYRDQRTLAWPSSRATGRAPKLDTHARPDAAGPKPCSAASSEGSKFGGYTANILAGYYLMSPLYALGDEGNGVRVAMFEQEPNLTSDISSYEKCYGVSTSVSYKKVDGGAGSGAGEGEAALDIEDTLGLAPKASIDVYQGPNSSTGTFDIYNAIISADKDAVISTSWGICELYNTSTLMNDEQKLFEEAASQGQTVFAAAGDSGSTGCQRSGGPDAGDLATLDPATQPLVNGVGGTEVTSSGESVWNESATESGAGGGGLSAYWCMPSYQYQKSIPGLISSHSATNSGCPAAEGHEIREDPDVSADADPFTGYVVFYKGAWTVIGGTSAAAPLWAAVAALVDDSPFCKAYGSGDAGVLSNGLWPTAGVDHAYIYSGGKYEPEIFRDITKGNNDYTPSGYTGGLYPATAGYDMASGLGSPLVSGVGAGGKVSMYYPGLAAAMCERYRTKLKSDSISSISPKSGPTKGGTKVTVNGKGFMPVAGADMAEIGTKLVAASCSTSTKCTVVMPKHAAGTVAIRIIAEDYFITPTTSADKFTYKA